MGMVMMSITRRTSSTSMSGVMFISIIGVGSLIRAWMLILASTVDDILYHKRASGSNASTAARVGKFDPSAATTCHMASNGPGRPRHDDVLTPAEWKVAEQVRHGMTNRRIAERMGVSLDAVKFHVGNALSKLGFSSREELRRWDGVAKGTALHHARSSGMAPQTTSDGYMMLGQVARTTKRFEESHAWYRDVLGLPELYSFGNLAFFDVGGVRLMLTSKKAISFRSRSSTFAYPISTRPRPSLKAAA
jgi:DNA-binding CsgD family transcriptional regulator